MIEISGTKNHGILVSMDEMKPLEIGTIYESISISSTKEYLGHIVMRTASTLNFEVIDLTNPGEDCCWTDRPTLTCIKVFIPKETVFTINISNKK